MSLRGFRKLGDLSNTLAFYRRPTECSTPATPASNHYVVKRQLMRLTNKLEMTRSGVHKASAGMRIVLMLPYSSGFHVKYSSDHFCQQVTNESIFQLIHIAAA